MAVPARRPAPLPPRQGGWAPYNPFPRGTPANDNFARFAGRLGGRLLPWLTAAKTLYEIWRWYDQHSWLFENYELCLSYSGPWGGFCTAPPMGIDWWSTRASCAAVTVCSAGGMQGFPNFVTNPPFIARGNQVHVAGIWRLEEIWQRIAPASGPVIYQAPGVRPLLPPDPKLPPGIDQPGVMPSPFPWFDPLLLPPGATEPVPINVPYPVIPVRPNPNPDVRPETPFRSYGRLRVARRPFHQIELSPRGNIRAQSRHRLRPPGKGVKERKLIGNVPSQSPLGRALSGFTEFNDLVNCLHDALPMAAKSWQGTIQSRAAAIYRNWDKIDARAAFVGCLSNQVEDVGFGMLGKAQARANRQLGLTGGSLGRTFGNIRRATK